MFAYAYWQFVGGPLWLLTLLVNMQRALLQLFSVPFMLRTLFAYWRKDSVSYRAGSLEGIALALAWNIISRVIGFIVRTLVIATWLVCALMVALLSVIAFAFFIFWPLVVVVGVLIGLTLLGQG